MFCLFRIVVFVIFCLFCVVVFRLICSSFLTRLILILIFVFTILKFEKFRFVNQIVVLLIFVITFFLFCDFRNLFFDFIIIDLLIFNKFSNLNIFKNVFNVNNNVKSLLICIIFRNVKLSNSKSLKKDFNIERSIQLFLLYNKF